MSCSTGKSTHFVPKYSGISVNPQARISRSQLLKFPPQPPPLLLTFLPLRGNERAVHPPRQLPNHFSLMSFPAPNPDSEVCLMPNTPHSDRDSAPYMTDSVAFSRLPHHHECSSAAPSSGCPMLAPSSGRMISQSGIINRYNEIVESKSSPSPTFTL